MASQPVVSDWASGRTLALLFLYVMVISSFQSRLIAMGRLECDQILQAIGAHSEPQSIADSVEQTFDRLSIYDFSEIIHAFRLHPHSGMTEELFQNERSRIHSQFIQKRKDWVQPENRLRAVQAWISDIERIVDSLNSTSQFRVRRYSLLQAALDEVRNLLPAIGQLEELRSEKPKMIAALRKVAISYRVDNDLQYFATKMAMLLEDRDPEVELGPDAMDGGGDIELAYDYLEAVVLGGKKWEKNKAAMASLVRPDKFLVMAEVLIGYQLLDFMGAISTVARLSISKVVTQILAIIEELTQSPDILQAMMAEQFLNDFDTSRNQSQLMSKLLSNIDLMISEGDIDNLHWALQDLEHHFDPSDEVEVLLKIKSIWDWAKLLEKSPNADLSVDTLQRQVMSTFAAHFERIRNWRAVYRTLKERVNFVRERREKLKPIFATVKSLNQTIDEERGDGDLP